VSAEEQRAVHGAIESFKRALTSEAPGQRAAPTPPPPWPPESTRGPRRGAWFAALVPHGSEGGGVPWTEQGIGVAYLHLANRCLSRAVGFAHRFFFIGEIAATERRHIRGQAQVETRVSSGDSF